MTSSYQYITKSRKDFGLFFRIPPPHPPKKNVRNKRPLHLLKRSYLRQLLSKFVNKVGNDKKNKPRGQKTNALFVI